MSAPHTPASMDVYLTLGPEGLGALTSRRRPCQPLWNPQVSRPVPGLWGVGGGQGMEDRGTNPWLFGEVAEMGPASQGLRSLAISEAAPLPVSQGMARGPASTWARAQLHWQHSPGREDVAHTHLLRCPASPLDSDTPTRQLSLRGDSGRPSLPQRGHSRGWGWHSGRCAHRAAYPFSQGSGDWWAPHRPTRAQGGSSPQH